MNKFDDVKLKKDGTLKKISGTNYFEVESEYIFELYRNYKIVGEVIIPVGFLTDFGSIPSIFFFFNKTKYISYILHDYLYNTISYIKFSNFSKNSQDRCLTKWESDYALFLGLENERMNIFGVLLVKIGLMIGGIFNYKKINNIIREINNFEENDNNLRK